MSTYEPLLKLRRWYTHIVLICIVEFGSEASRGLALSTMYSYARLLHADIAFVGQLVSLFSAGRFLSSFFFGWLSDRWSFHRVYYLATCIALFGNLGYILVYAYPFRSKFFLGLTRFVVGIGAGTRSVCRANIAALTRPDQKVQYFNYFAVVNFLAYAITPGVGALYGVYRLTLVQDYVEINQYTIPGFILVFFNACTLLAIYLLYDMNVARSDAPGGFDLESKTTVSNVPNQIIDLQNPSTQIDPIKNPFEAEKETENRLSSENVDVISSCNAQKDLENLVAHTDHFARYVTYGVILFIFQNFVTRGMLAIFETINVPLFRNFRYSDTISLETLSMESSKFYFTLGLFGLLTFAFVRYMNHISSSIYLITSLSILLFGNLLLSIIHSQILSYRYIVFIIAEICIWSIGSPLAAVAITSSFSKILGTKPQGFYMGVFGSAGSVGRMVMPLLAGWLANQWSVLFLIQMSSIAVCLILFLVYTRTGTISI